MKPTMMGLTLFLLITSVWAGIWREDFTDGIENTLFDKWPDGAIGKGKDVAIVIENGFLDIRLLRPQGSIGFGIPTPFQEQRIPPRENWKDYTVRMRMKFVDLPQGVGESIQGIELSVRHNRDTHEQYQAGFFTKTHHVQESHAILEKLIPDANPIPEHVGRRVLIRKELISKALPEPIALGVWYNLKVVAQGNHISFQVNKDFTISTIDTDHPFITGTLGFVVYSAHVMVDYIEVSGQDVPDSDLSMAVNPQAKLTTIWGRIKSNKGKVR